MNIKSKKPKKKENEKLMKMEEFKHNRETLLQIQQIRLIDNL